MEDEGKQIKFFYGVSWLIEPGAPPEDALSYRFSSRKNQKEYFWLASLLREHQKKIDYSGKERAPFTIKLEDLFVIGSSPRPYSERQYDCAKSDIVMVAPIELEQEAIRVFEEKVSEAKEEKKKAYTYVGDIQKVLDELTISGAIDGVLGRGSYFDPNGLPVPDDDIDFIILRRAPRTEETLNKIKEILRGIDGSVELLVKKVEPIRESGKRPILTYSFWLFDTERAQASRGIMYEIYILTHSPGIETKNVSKAEAEEIGKEIASRIKLLK